MIKKKFTAAVMAFGISVSLLLQTPVWAAQESPEQTSAITTNAIPGWPQAADISSTAAVVMESSTKTSLFSKNADDYSIIWDYVVVNYDNFVIKNIYSFVVNTETKELSFISKV